MCIRDRTSTTRRGLRAVMLTRPVRWDVCAELHSRTGKRGSRRCFTTSRWTRQWRARQAHGDVVIVRFADDLVVGFQHRADAERFYADLVQRFARFGLELNAEKTRLIEFGRFAAENRRRRGLGRPETFSFLGFTHMCAKTRAGRFALRRKTIAK